MDDDAISLGHVADGGDGLSTHSSLSRSQDTDLTSKLLEEEEDQVPLTDSIMKNSSDMATKSISETQDRLDSAPSTPSTSSSPSQSQNSDTPEIVNDHPALSSIGSIFSVNSSCSLCSTEDWATIFLHLISPFQDPPFPGPHTAIQFPHSPWEGSWLHIPRDIDDQHRAEIEDGIAEIWRGWNASELAAPEEEEEEGEGGNVELVGPPPTSYPMSSRPYPSPFDRPHTPIVITGSFFRGWFIHIPRYLSSSEIENAKLNIGRLTQYPWNYGDAFERAGMLSGDLREWHWGLLKMQKAMAEFLKRRVGVRFSAQDSEVEGEGGTETPPIWTKWPLETPGWKGWDDAFRRMGWIPSPPNPVIDAAARAMSENVAAWPREAEGSEAGTPPESEEDEGVVGEKKDSKYMNDDESSFWKYHSEALRAEQDAEADLPDKRGHWNPGSGRRRDSGSTLYSLTDTGETVTLGTEREGVGFPAVKAPPSGYVGHEIEIEIEDMLDDGESSFSGSDGDVILELDFPVLESNGRLLDRHSVGDELLDNVSPADSASSWSLLGIAGNRSVLETESHGAGNIQNQSQANAFTGHDQTRVALQIPGEARRTTAQQPPTLISRAASGPTKIPCPRVISTCTGDSTGQAMESEEQFKSGKAPKNNARHRQKKATPASSPVNHESIPPLWQRVAFQLLIHTFTVMACWEAYCSWYRRNHSRPQITCSEFTNTLQDLDSQAIRSFLITRKGVSLVVGLTLLQVLVTHNATLERKWRFWPWNWVLKPLILGVWMVVGKVRTLYRGLSFWTWKRVLEDAFLLFFFGLGAFLCGAMWYSNHLGMGIKPTSTTSPNTAVGFDTSYHKTACRSTFPWDTGSILVVISTLPVFFLLWLGIIANLGSLERRRSEAVKRRKTEVLEWVIIEGLCSVVVWSGVELAGWMYC